MMKSLMIISMVVFPTVTNAQLAMTTENRSLTRATPNAPQTSPTYSWQPNNSAGATQGWQSTVPTGGVRTVIPQWQEIE
jgi:hypothetical protein